MNPKTLLCGNWKIERASFPQSNTVIMYQFRIWLRIPDSSTYTYAGAVQYTFENKKIVSEKWSGRNSCSPNNPYWIIALFEEAERKGEI